MNEDDDEVHLRSRPLEGARIEWDGLAGIMIPGAGTIVEIGRVPEQPTVCVQMDPNQRLRAFMAEVRAGVPTPALHPPREMDFGVRGASS